MKTIKVTIRPDGSLDIDVSGVKGKSCKDITKAIEDLGAVVDSKKKPEYNQAETKDTIKHRS